MAAMKLHDEKKTATMKRHNEDKKMILYEQVPVIDLKATGERINELKNAAGITVRDIQMVMGFSSPYPVYKWINGKNLPTIDNLMILATILGVKMDDIVMSKA